MSTLMVAAADRVWGTTVAVMGANITALGLLWVAKFMAPNLCARRPSGRYGRLGGGPRQPYWVD